MKTVFLDRDGVICENRADHVKNWSEFRFLPGAIEGIVALTAAGCRIVVVTNQAVVRRGQVSAMEVEAIHTQMTQQVAAAGGRIDLVLYCPHRPDEGCNCRKPQPGLLLSAAEQLGVDWRDAYLVGDHWTDIQAGLRTGCRPILVLTGRGLRALFSTEARKQQGYIISRSLKHTVKHILRDDQRWPYGVAQRIWYESRQVVKLSWTLARPAAEAESVTGSRNRAWN